MSSYLCIASYIILVTSGLGCYAEFQVTSADFMSELRTIFYSSLCVRISSSDDRSRATFFEARFLKNIFLVLADPPREDFLQKQFFSLLNSSIVAGCGKHIEQVMSQIPEKDRCVCNPQHASKWIASAVWDVNAEFRLQNASSSSPKCYSAHVMCWHRDSPPASQIVWLGIHLSKAITCNSVYSPTWIVENSQELAFASLSAIL